MYTPVKKRFIRPVNRRHARTARIKKIAVFLTLLVLLEGGYLLWQQGKSYIENFKMPTFFTWQIKQINIQAPTENLKSEIENYLAKKEIKTEIPLTSEQAKNLQTQLNESIKNIKDIKVKRKFFTKELSVSAEKFIPYAKIITQNEEFFITEDGQIFKDNDPQIKEGFLNIFLNGKIESEILAKELVQFIKEIKTNSLRETDKVSIDLTEQTSVFQTKYGPVKLKDFKEVKNQLSVLTEILKISQGKNFILPYFTDFTYFNKGKVYLRQGYKDL